MRLTLGLLLSATLASAAPQSPPGLQIWGLEKRGLPVVGFRNLINPIKQLTSVVVSP